MDPNAALAELEQLLTNPAVIDDARVAELTQAVRAWLKRGGFWPDWPRYPHATIHVTGWTRPPASSLRVLTVTPEYVSLRIPSAQARPIPNGCHCRHCQARPDLPPRWDTLIVPLRPGAYPYEVHAPEWKIDPRTPAPVTTTDPRD